MSEAGQRTGPFRAADRLLDSRDFRRVLRQGRRRAGSDLVVIVAPSPSTSWSDSEKTRENRDLSAGRGNRLGITVSRKVGNAVCRNRFKRRVRAWFRERRGQLGENVDLVVIARKSGGQLDSVELDARLGELLGLANAVR